MVFSWCLATSTYKWFQGNAHTICSMLKPMFATTMRIFIPCMARGLGACYIPWLIIMVDKSGRQEHIRTSHPFLCALVIDCWDQMNYKLFKHFHLLSSCFTFMLFTLSSIVTGLNEMVEWDMKWTNKFTFVGVARFRLSYNTLYISKPFISSKSTYERATRVRACNNIKILCRLCKM